ncbi:MAG: GNAT family N-acetyltransferase [Saprospiraceae bacterium]
MTDQIKIRSVQQSDNPILAKIIRAVFIEHDAPTAGTVFVDPTTDALFELFEMPKAELWTAELNGNIVGCCGIYPTDNLPKGCVELVKFYLAKAARGKGIGRLLMDKSLATAKDYGYTEMYIESLPHYAKAVNIYEKLGFTRLQNPLGNSGHSGCNIWMLKQL